NPGAHEERDEKGLHDQHNRPINRSDKPNPHAQQEGKRRNKQRSDRKAAPDRDVHLVFPRLKAPIGRSEEHTSELQSRENLVCRPRTTVVPYTTLFRSQTPAPMRNATRRACMISITGPSTGAINRIPTLNKKANAAISSDLIAKPLQTAMSTSYSRA